nr:MAG TPA: hypothetical protein [Caudoviricetes sp.]DAL85141.1 MAG TPA: hypothetical protein [Bacteriophage sp.]DAT34103.1 MAG TPA: hypothetical protein [Caudoviricetes sp.]
MAACGRRPDPLGTAYEPRHIIGRYVDFSGKDGRMGGE